MTPETVIHRFAKNLKIEMQLITIYADFIIFGTQNNTVFSVAHSHYKWLLMHFDYAFQFYIVTRLTDVCKNWNKSNKRYSYPEWIRLLQNSVSSKSKAATGLIDIQCHLDRLVKSDSFKYLEKIRSQRFVHHERKKLSPKKKAMVAECIASLEAIHNSLCRTSGAIDCCIHWSKGHHMNFTSGETAMNELMIALESEPPIRTHRISHMN